MMVSKFQKGDLVEIKYEARPEIFIYIEEIIPNHFRPVHSISKTYDINNARYRDVYTDYLRKIDE
jgi:hypothetical protein